MHAALAARLPFEVLDCVGHIDFLARDACFIERAIEHRACRTHERLALQILLIAGLLADDHQRRMTRTRARHRLRRVLVERAAMAFVERIRSLVGFYAGLSDGRHGMRPQPFAMRRAASSVSGSRVASASRLVAALRSHDMTARSASPFVV